MIPNLPLLIGFSAQRAAIQAYPRSSIANQTPALVQIGYLGESSCNTKLAEKLCEGLGNSEFWRQL
jgi:hypothetical protein